MKKVKKMSSPESNFQGLVNKTIVIGISGGIAAYKCLDLISNLRSLGANVHCVLSKNASHFVTPLSLSTLSRNKVHIDNFALKDSWQPEHIELAKTADLVLIAPATADIIAKLAHGICDDLLTTFVLATKAKVLIAPAMNPNMYEHVATRDNIAVLEHKLRYQIIPPEFGEVACGDLGYGKMAQITTIAQVVASSLEIHGSLLDKKILITAGGTREPIDPVRFIGNRSSGKMGIAMADAAYARGADVTLVSTVKVDRNYPVILVETAQEMQESVESEFDTCDALIMTAAVADFRPLFVSVQKIKKSDSEDFSLDLTQNPDIIDLLSRVKRENQIVIGFAAESEELLSNASQKLKRKKLDLIIANDITVPEIGFGSDDNAVIILSNDGSKETLPRMPKRAIAEHICDILASRFLEIKELTLR